MYIFCFPSHGVQICGAAIENLRLQPSRDIAKTLERHQREREIHHQPLSLVFLTSTLSVSFSIASFPSTNHYLILSQKKKKWNS